MMIVRLAWALDITVCSVVDHHWESIPFFRFVCGFHNLSKSEYFFRDKIPLQNKTAISSDRTLLT